jgi:hypothetical protein
MSKISVNGAANSGSSCFVRCLLAGLLMVSLSCPVEVNGAKPLPGGKWGNSLVA